jgi:hypothetical protein
MENRSSGSSGTTHPFGIILGGERRVPHPFREAADGGPEAVQQSPSSPRTAAA